MRCSRCKGRLVRDRMHDLPRKIQEFSCINCGERFWQELQQADSVGIAPAAPPEVRPAQVEAQPNGYPWFVAQTRN